MRTSVRSLAGWPRLGSCCVKLSTGVALAPDGVVEHAVDLRRLVHAHRLDERAFATRLGSGRGR